MEQSAGDVTSELAGQGRVVFRCGVLVDGSSDDAREDWAVAVERGRVVAAEPWSESLSARWQAEEVRDLGGRSVIPGIIDAHTHPFIGSPTSEDWRSYRNDSLGTLAWGFLSCVTALRTGVTTIVDVGSPNGVAIPAAAMLEAGLVTGPKLFASGAAITTTAGHASELCGVCADGVDELVGTVRRTVAAGADLVKLMVTGGASDPATNRRRAQYSEFELRAAIDDAHRLEKVVVGHANATEGIRLAVSAGIDVIAHCNWLGVEPGSIVIDVATVERMVQQGTRIDLNLEGALRDLDLDGTVADWPYAEPVPRTRWDLLQPMRRQGIPIYLTSDAFGPALGSFTSSLHTAQRRWELPVEELISLVTSVPARALGLADRGLLAPGYVADLVVLPGDIRSSTDALLTPVSVYRSGREVVRDGWLAAPAATQGSEGETAAQEEFLKQVFEQLR